MLSGKLKYYKGSVNSRESVEIDVLEENGDYITTCVVDVGLLVCGISGFPCGNGNDIDFTPEQQLTILRFVQKERKRLTEGIYIKTMDGWHESGLPTFEDYFAPGDRVSEDIVDYFANSVPPVTLRSGFVQAGEAYSFEKDPETENFRSTYITFSRIKARHWRFEGYCFKDSNANRATCKKRLEERISEVEREVAAHV